LETKAAKATMLAKATISNINNPVVRMGYLLSEVQFFITNQGFSNLKSQFVISSWTEQAFYKSQTKRPCVLPL
jgi:hypothetical protein